MLPVLNMLPASAAGTNLALGKTATASSSNGQYVTGNLNDGNQASYWESTGAFPQWAQIDLGSATSVNQAVLKLPTGWGARTETLSVQGSTDGSTFSTIVASAGYTFDPNSSNTVTINFGATSTRYLRINITANTGWAAAQLSELELYGATGGGTSANLALGKTMSSSGVSQTYAASNANDGNQATYWESTNNAFPQWLQVDLGASVSVNQVVLKLPADSSWATRTETLTVQGSTDNSNFSTLVASAGYSFNPSTGNTVTITVPTATTRYLRLLITANTGWPAGQISEFEVYGPTSGDVTPPSAPTGLAYTSPASGQIKLTWNASTDNVGVTGYDLYRNGVLATTVTGLTYTDSQPDTATVSYYVRAHDAVGNQSGNSNTVTRTGSAPVDTTPPTAPGNLAYTSPASGQIALSWTASTDNVGVTGYDIYRNGSLATTVTGLTYTDSQPDTATVSYYVKAHDAAGNQSAASNTVTRTGSGGGGPGTNLAIGKPITGTPATFTFVATNANDNDVTTYFEGASYPSQLTVQLGANADVSSIVVKLNPDASWGTRTQTIQVLGREQSATGFTSISPATAYTFNPATGNTVSIPVTARVADVELSITSNTGAPGGQAAEFQVIGVPAPNPDLTVTASSWTPTAPIETDSITASATVKNTGTAAAGATNVNFYLGTTKVGTAAVGALAAGASSTVSASIGTQSAGSYALTAKVDEANTVVELNDANNSYTNPTNLVVTPVQSSDLVPSAVTWSPSTPAAGNTVNFNVTLKNQGTVATASGAHAITLTLLDSNNSVVKTLTGSYSGSLASGASSGPVALGSWTAANGKYTLHTQVAVDANELPIKQGNNTSDTSFFVGRGANMPYDSYEAEDGMIGGGAAVVGPNRTIGDLAGEASGRKAVTLNSTGSYVQWNTTDPTNTLVTRFSIPDAAGGGGTTATLDVYVNGTFAQTITLNSKYAWLYGAETGPGNDPSAAGPRHIYDEAHVILNTPVPANSVIRLQKDAANTSQYAIDYINTEQVAPVANPDPTKYLVPAGFGQQDVQNALTTVANSSTYTGVYLPAGQYQTTGKFQVGQKAIKVVGAGPWYTQFSTDQTQANTDAGFSVQSSANGSTFSGFAFFGNYTSRIDGPGKVFDLTDVSNLTIDNIWVEHTVVAIWGTHVTGLTATNMRIRDTFADGINLTNGSSGNLVSNDEARSTGDDSFALFAAQDHNSSDLTNNTFQNLTAVTPWRAAGIAVYGGENNIMQNLYVADTLTYAGITISSLNFGYPFQGFGTQPTTIQNVSLVRDGGHFWSGQVFPAIWVFSATQPFQGIRVNSVDITDPTYSGIMFQTDYVGSTAQYPVTDTIFTNVSITGAQQSGDAYNAKSGYGIWANQLPEAGQGPAVGTAVFNHLTESNNFINIQNTTSTFTITVNP
ncbi:discoidin domain-containing protein [Streptacidiphilus sp. N1-12]|uniref:Discoidin domain-containing protein n=2 Tax=Streptacidiphilus alkalitolerans TaxID=3342712 RepID=A0ABV6W7D1_9ACTN